MILACLKPLALLLLPFVAAWLITSYSPIESRWALRLVAFAVAAQVVCVAVLPMAMMTAVALGNAAEASLAGGGGVTTMTVDGKTAVSYSQPSGLLPHLPGESPAPINALHSRGGEWHGRDYVRSCGAAIVAPFAGQVTRGGAGILDGWGNPYIYLQSADGRYDMLLMHGDYLLSAGEQFKAGQRIGSTNLTGYFIGSAPVCHDHVSLLDNGVEVDPEKYRSVNVGAPTPGRDMAGISATLASLGYAPNGGHPLRVSHYDPSLGGTNCDSDCSTMASGQKVAAWVGGQNGIYAAACPTEWPFGTRFKLAGKVYQCQDRGGWIKTRHAGEYDPAMGGFTAAETYHWVDLLDTPPVPYGSLVHDWKFVD